MSASQRHFLLPRAASSSPRIDSGLRFLFVISCTLASQDTVKTKPHSRPNHTTSEPRVNPCLGGELE